MCCCVSYVLLSKTISIISNICLNSIISFIQMLVTNTTPKVEVRIGVSLSHPLLITQGHNSQNYIKIYKLSRPNIYISQLFVLF